MLQRYVMGTFLSVRIRVGNASESRQAYELFFDEIQRLERLLSIYQPESDIARINQAAGQSPIQVSADAYRVVDEALRYAEDSFGAFDPTASCKPSPRQAVSRGLSYRQVLLNSENRTIFLEASDLRLDLGGIGKGFALDRALERATVLPTTQSVRADFGGQLLFWDREGPFAPERVAIENPQNRQDILSTFEVDHNCSVSTSSNSERYSHLTDPRANAPAQGSLSATAVAATATEAEALSTALFILNPDEQTALLRKFPAAKAFVYPSMNPEYHLKRYENRSILIRR